MQPRPSLMSITSRTIAIVLAMALVAVISLAGTRAVFTATTDNATNSFATGDIDLVDDDTTIMFSVVGMFPGDVVDHCIEVTYSGPNSQPTNGVNIYVPATWVDSASLADDLIVTIEEGAKPGVGFLPTGTRTGDDDAQGDCAGFTSTAFIVTTTDLSDPGFPTNYADNAGTWTPGASNPESLTYRITVTLDSASTAEGQSVTAIPFTWEVQAGS